MFTGIIEDIGKIEYLEKKGKGGRIAIRSLLKSESLKIGFSIAVNGCCLTVVDFKDGLFIADISEETLKKTNLGGLKKGDMVNLETPLTPLKPLGGHIVTGHIDCVGHVLDKIYEGENAVYEISIPKEFHRLVVYKGSIAVDGVSLTVSDVAERGFRVALIPHTLKATTIGQKRAGSKVNIETDIIGKYVERFSGVYKQAVITEDFLKEHGFFKGK